MKRVAIVLALVLIALVPLGAQRPPHPRLFAPEELGLLESPDRDDWQEPERVMDRLGISEGARVADIGAGGGWFTVRLARRAVHGVVFAEDIQPLMIESIKRRVKREGLRNVKPILGTSTDPHLPAGLDTVLLVDLYTQLSDPVGLLKQIEKALGPKGQLGIVDFTPDGNGGPGPALEERVSPEVIKKAAASAGLVLRSHETFLRYHTC
jgi:SAM-dependent methyltransferase